MRGSAARGGRFRPRVSHWRRDLGQGRQRKVQRSLPPRDATPATFRFLASNSSCIVTRSIPLVTVCSWTTASLPPRIKPSALRPDTVTPQQKGHLQGVELHRGHRSRRRHGRVHRQRASSDDGSGTVTRVCRHWS